ncbi:MAG: JAB domain-containing protein [Pseudomonadota bacterium]
MFFISSIILLFGYIIWLTRPLDYDSIKIVGESKRLSDIKNYYLKKSAGFFDSTGIKKTWNKFQAGEFLKVDFSLNVFPGIVSAFLNGKKHEWVIIGFVSKLNVKMIWIKKGDRRRVLLGLDNEELISLARENNADTVVILHNHPNPNARIYNCSKPSAADLGSAGRIARALNSAFITLLEFVCERGSSYLFFLAPSRKCFPLEQYYKAIMADAGKFAFTNILYRLQYLFFKRRTNSHYVMEG